MNKGQGRLWVNGKALGSPGPNAGLGVQLQVPVLRGAAVANINYLLDRTQNHLRGVPGEPVRDYLG